MSHKILSKAQAKLHRRVAQLSTVQLCDVWNETEKHLTNKHTYIVHDYLLMEFERRDPEAFELFILSSEGDPMPFFCPAVHYRQKTQ